MPRRRERDDDDRDDDRQDVAAEDTTVSRDFVMARLAACRSSLSAAIAGVDEAIDLFVDPDDDKKGDKRGELLESIDDLCGAAAVSVQQAQAAYEDVDPKEAEPEAVTDD